MILFKKYQIKQYLYDLSLENDINQKILLLIVNTLNIQQLNWLAYYTTDYPICTIDMHPIQLKNILRIIYTILLFTPDYQQYTAYMGLHLIYIQNCILDIIKKNTINIWLNYNRIQTLQTKIPYLICLEIGEYL